MAIVDDINVVMLSKALDASVLRQQAIAQNLANVNTPGYRRLAVQFEADLAAALRSGQPGRITQVAPRMAEAALAEGNQGTDEELAHLSETVLHHHALVTVLGKRIGLISTAISEGKK
jgi:flagellar basal-body rod protein FlgB